MTVNWFETYDNVTALGRWLMQEEHYSGADLQRYYEKPWAWTDKWSLMKEDALAVAEEARKG